MIVYDLGCPAGHTFEAWFKDSATFEKQARQGKVACPACGATKVTRGPQATNIATGVSRGKTVKAAEQQAEMRAALRELRKAVETNCENVGNNFAEEARKIHYGEAEARGIYGETTPDEAKALDEEGIPVARLPWVEREDA
ncbi:DUF1178 family protein [Zavarzinia compransoris]|uniref:DUF1178 domain-containing protein n=1 Tax=Zavarzinia compransoris TaxID=1264899 RepID=A0A317E7A8_9PROT|nr:DUF1178 family protein [Zavarzinia compransoris]PWR22382.1 DUF1178 domain-containing protein [Zavarzinia compransoris]TDP46847.1 hypothetical protein DES42_10313 [Zavarzinia compransoris]